MLDERKHQVTLSISPGELEVNADPARLEQVLAGLLGHVAGTADPGGRIRLSVGREHDTIVFRVRDQGQDASSATSPGPRIGPRRAASRRGSRASDGC